jgi:DNA-binding CsgD family transcriptional regulator
MPDGVVGRERELERAEVFLRDVEGGSAALVLEGEAGIGKTTLWLEVIRSAEARGFRVLQAGSVQTEVGLSYAALTDLVGASFDAVRGMLPEPQARALAVALLRDDSAVADARATAVGLVGILAELAGDGPVLVAVDDVQWLDAASERALRFAARRLPERIGLLLTRRGEPGEELPLGLAGALREDRVGRLVLLPLSLAALHHIISGRLDWSPARPLLGRLGDACGGNPFFALEIARALMAVRDEQALGDPLPVPPSLRELLAIRLQRLSAAAREIVFVAAALLRPSLETLTAAVGPNVDVGSALIEAEEEGVLRSEQGRILFAHPLLASAVYGSASAQRRRALHRQLAQLASDPEERARHLAQGTTGLDSKAAAEIEVGARRAARRGAQDAAAELFEAAHRMTPADDADELARRLLGHASALNAVGDSAGARSLAQRSVESARAPSLRVAGLSLLGTLAWFGGDAAGAVARLEQALDAAGDDRQLQGPIYAKLVRFSFTLDFERAAVHADAALALLDEEREPALLAHVLIDRFFAGALLGRPVAYELFARGVELEVRALERGPDAPHPIPLIWYWCTDESDLARARHAIEDEWYSERGEEVWQANRRAHMAPIELRAGHWDVAERYAEESCAALEQVDVHGPMLLVFEKRALVDAHRGRIERARTTLEALIGEFERAGQAWWAALALATLAFAEFSAGDHMAVDRALARMHEHAGSLGVKDVVQDRSEPFHIESLLALGQVDHARKVLARLEERGRILPRLWISVTLPRARALVLAAEGDLTAAFAALDALDWELASRLPFDLAWTLLVKGRLLRRNKQKRAAADTLRHAHDVFEQLGAPRWVDEARGEFQRVGLRPAAPDELTESERRVAELVATGVTNREAAAQLFMSPKTVEATLARVYRKLGIHSRAQLGARLAGAGTHSTQM